MVLRPAGRTAWDGPDPRRVALLLELDQVYRTCEGLLSVQIALSVTAMLLALGLRALGPGERLPLEAGAPRAT